VAQNEIPKPMGNAPLETKTVQYDRSHLVWSDLSNLTRVMTQNDASHMYPFISILVKCSGSRSKKTKMKKVDTTIDDTTINLDEVVSMNGVPQLPLAKVKQTLKK